jgi:hypothetical protein
MKFSKNSISLLACTLLVMATSAWAHGGGQDKQGGHYNSKTGIYHCHKDGCVNKSDKSADHHDRSKKKNSHVRVTAANGEYNRKDWPHWVDLDHDCQDARTEAFIRLSSTPVQFKRKEGCSVSQGTFYGAYTNKTYSIARDLDLDHVVPLGDAHETGGYAWSREKRRAFANDPLNLIPVNLSENRSKGKRSPMEYMPPYKPYHCEYLSRWIEIKQKYGLEIRTGVKMMQKKACV